MRLSAFTTLFCALYSIFVKDNDIYDSSIYRILNTNDNDNDYDVKTTDCNFKYTIKIATITIDNVTVTKVRKVKHVTTLIKVTKMNSTFLRHQS